MRELTTAKTLARFMAELGRAVRNPCSVFFTGGATAVLHGWRESTVDVDLKPIPDSDEVLRALPRLKDELHVNVELASPADFVPELPGWRERSLFIEKDGDVTFYHYDPYTQVLSKIERGHEQDVEDVHNFLSSGLVDGARLLQLFDRVEAELYRFPAIDSGALRRAVEAAVRS
jgi:uncharacterized nucleotidyltransferase DUF6036